MIDPVGQAMLRLYPTPNNINANTITNFASVPNRSLNEGEFDVRLDHNFSTKDSLFARFSYDQAVSFIPGGSPGYAAPSPFASTQNITNHGRNVVVSETHIFSSNNINQISAGFNRIFNHIKSFGDGTCEAANLGILGADLNTKCPNGVPGWSQSSSDCMSCGMTATLMNNYWGLGDRGFAPFQGGTNVFSISDSFDMIRGKHNIRIGGSIRANQMNVETNAFQDGFFINFGLSNDATADVLLGQMGGILHDQTFFGATTGRRWKLFRPYIQDDWRVTPNLTLNLGVAWALVTPITEAQGRQANYDVASGKMFVDGPASITGCDFCVHSSGAAGVGRTPPRKTSPPAAVTPAASAASSMSPDSRVSRMTSTCGRSASTRSVAARPRASASSAVSSSPAGPRMPSVPKSRRVTAGEWLSASRTAAACGPSSARPCGAP